MNIKKYYLYRVFEDLMPIYPLYLLMFESRNLSMAQISFLLAIWSIPAVVLEVPTGILADRWSRKNLIVLGGLLRACCYLTWMLSDGFLMYALGFVFWGIGGSLQSGSEEALLFDSLKVQGEEGRFDLILGRGHFLSGISNILAAITGGFIGSKYGFQTALSLSVISSIITAGIAFTMKEVNLYKEHFQEQNEDEKEDTLRVALAFLLKYKEILLITLLALFVITTAGVLDEYDQLIAKEYGLSIKLIGIWTAFRFILTAVGSFLARGIRIVVERIFQIKERLYSISFLCIVAAIFLIIAGLVKQIGIMGLYGLYYLIMSAGEVIYEDYIQQKIQMEGRSTIHSLIALSQNLYGIMCYGLFGLLATKSDLHWGLIWSGAYIIVWTIILGVAYFIIGIKRYRKNR